MKYKAMVLLVLFGVAIFLSYYLITASLDNQFDKQKSILLGQTKVDINDISKNLSDFLNGERKDAVSSDFKQKGYDVVLYRLDGKIVFDSKSEQSIGTQMGINELLLNEDSEKQLFIVQTKKNENYIGVVDTHSKKINLEELHASVRIRFVILSIVFVVLIALIFLFIYVHVIRPFRKLERFAAEVAKGNLDEPLAQQRQNIFGAFTWAFDMLRSELKTSKEREMEAEKTKKELVVALSHDLRTPIASIKAYAECMQSLPEKDSERGEHYINVIIKKADEISKLSQDMFLHAISDLQKLEINGGEYMSRELLLGIIEPLRLQYERIIITSAIPDKVVFTDPQRLAQVFENVVSNAVKYANGSRIDISVEVAGEYLKCSIMDYGEGAIPEDLPFLFEKFFRGQNAKNSGQAGSGLGLYISKYILEKTGGSITASNHHQNGGSGFLVDINLRLI